MKPRQQHFHVDRQGNVFDRETFLAMSLAALAGARTPKGNGEAPALLDAHMMANAVWVTDEASRMPDRPGI